MRAIVPKLVYRINHPKAIRQPLEVPLFKVKGSQDFWIRIATLDNNLFQVLPAV